MVRKRNTEEERDNRKKEWRKEWLKEREKELNKEKEIRKWKTDIKKKET